MYGLPGRRGWRSIMLEEGRRRRRKLAFKLSATVAAGLLAGFLLVDMLIRCCS